MIIHSSAILVSDFLQDTWASEHQNLNQFLYYTYNKTDFDLMHKDYGDPGYHKLNATLYAHINSSLWPVKLDKLYQSKCKLFVVKDCL